MTWSEFFRSALTDARPSAGAQHIIMGLVFALAVCLVASAAAMLV